MSNQKSLIFAIFGTGINLEDAIAIMIRNIVYVYYILRIKSEGIRLLYIGQDTSKRIRRKLRDKSIPSLCEMKLIQFYK